MKVLHKAIIVLGLIKYLFFTKFSTAYSKEWLRLLKTLQPFRQARLVTQSITLKYLSSYLSHAFSTRQRLAIMTHHYSFLQHTFDEEQLKKLFISGIECYAAQSDGDTFTILLAYGAGYEFESPLSMFLVVNGVRVANLGFAIVPGPLLGFKEEHVMYLSCLQKLNVPGNGFAKAIKYFDDVHPSILLLRTAGLLAHCFGIRHGVAVSARNQLSFNAKTMDYSHFKGMYDDFWLTRGARPYRGDYLLSFPLMHKPILTVKQYHRNRIRKKRIQIEEVCRETGEQLNRLFYPEEIEEPATR